MHLNYSDSGVEGEILCISHDTLFIQSDLHGEPTGVRTSRTLISQPSDRGAGPSLPSCMARKNRSPAKYLAVYQEHKSVVKVTVGHTHLLHQESKESVSIRFSGPRSTSK